MVILGIKPGDNKGKPKRWYPTAQPGEISKTREDLIARFTGGKSKPEDKRVYIMSGAERTIDREHRGTLLTVEILDYRCATTVRGIYSIALLPLGFFEMETSEKTTMSESLFKKLYLGRAEEFWNELIEVEETYARQPEVEHTPYLRNLIAKVGSKAGYLYETFQYTNRFTSFHGGH